MLNMKRHFHSFFHRDWLPDSGFIHAAICVNYNAQQNTPLNLRLCRFGLYSG
jgi:hypothetical protein